jgi:fluoride ion exporter CrcB/FEX
MLDWIGIFLVMIGEAAGSLARYVAGTATMERFGSRFPLGTLLVNVPDSFLIGLLMTLLTEHWPVVEEMMDTGVIALSDVDVNRIQKSLLTI